MAAAPIRIIAWGNVGRRDDGAALVLADRLQQHYAHADDVVIQQYHQLGPELVEDLHRCRLAVFVDAHAHADGLAVTSQQVLPATAGGLDTHHCSPDALLGLVAALGLTVPPAWLIGIRGNDWEFGDTLSPPTQEAVLEAERLAISLIAPHRQTGFHVP